MSGLIRILTVDDHRVFREGLAMILATQPDMNLVAEASNGREAIQQLRAHSPDITLMDLQMPIMTGLQAMAAIRKEFPEAKKRCQGRDEARCSRVLGKDPPGQRTLGDHPSRASREIRLGAQIWHWAVVVSS